MSNNDNILVLISRSIYQRLKLLNELNKINEHKCGLTENHGELQINPSNDIELMKLFRPHLHLDKVDSIDEILLSDEWLDFKKSITKDFDKAPKVCKRYCGTKQQFKGIVK